jgi:hypothetical protein
MYVLATQTKHLVIADVYPLNEAHIISRIDLKQFQVLWAEMLVSVCVYVCIIRMYVCMYVCRYASMDLKQSQV